MDEGIEWYKKELEAMRQIVHSVNQNNEMDKKQQKHEEIKQKAWEHHLLNDRYFDLSFSWNDAEEFCNYAKEKEEGNV